MHPCDMGKSKYISYKQYKIRKQDGKVRTAVMKRNRFTKNIIVFICCLFIIGTFCNTNCTIVYAYELTEDKTVIFVIDTSGSMQSNDPDRIAIDSIAQLIYSLPTNYKIGLVSYSAETEAKQLPVGNKDRRTIAKAAEALKYQGYSNAGAGLTSAISLLLNDTAQEQHIILLSDGEILLDSDSKTEEAANQYQTAIKQAKDSGIRIHVIGLGDEMSDMSSPIFDAAKETAGSSFYKEEARGIQDAIDTILKEQFGVKQSTLAIVDADGEMETISADLPYEHADKIRVLITCNKPISNLKVNLQAQSAEQINGERYSLIEINKPTDGQLRISFEGEKGSQARVNVIPEYHVAPQVSVEYVDTIPLDRDTTIEQPCDRTAHITYTFVSADNPTIQLWNNTYFNHSKIPVTTKKAAEESTSELFLDNGQFTQQEKVIGAQEYEVFFDYSKLTVNVIGADTAKINLEAAPILPAEIPEPEPEPPYLLIGILVVCLLLLALVIVYTIWNNSRKKPIALPLEDKPEPSKYSYVGKLNIYITQTRSGYDIPPLSYDLFRLPSGKVLSLFEVLDSCGVKERFPGAETIYIKAGANRSLIITNNSDCTIMKSREILLKRRSYQLTLDSKVDITFEDEISELTFQYKDVRLSAMR